MAANSTESMLKESIKLFLSQYESGSCEFSHFNLMFCRLINTMGSPPIEVTWFYAAVKFKSENKKGEEKMGRIKGIKELFQMLVSCSGPCSSRLKKVAVLAPLVFELYNMICGTVVSVDLEQEIGCLIERLVSFISLCLCEAEADDNHDDTLTFSLVDLVRVWTVGLQTCASPTASQLFNMFFPIIGDMARNELCASTSVGVLAGIVMCQAFLLHLCFQFRISSPVQLQDMAVSTITGFRSCYFFDTLLKMMLEPTLPVASLLNVADEARLQEVMFDAIILVNYPCFNPACGIHLCRYHLNKLATTWLFVADKGMQFARHNDDETKEISYMNAFSSSFILSQLLKWVSAQIVIVEEANRTTLTTPVAFMQWIVELRSRVSSGFDVEFSVLCEKAVIYLAQIKSTLSHVKEPNNNFSIDQTMDEDSEMIDSTNGVKAICNSNFSDFDSCRKRKEENDECGLRVKLLKYQVHDSPIKIISPFQTEFGLIRRT